MKEYVLNNFRTLCEYIPYSIYTDDCYPEDSTIRCVRWKVNNVNHELYLRNKEIRYKAYTYECHDNNQCFESGTFKIVLTDLEMFEILSKLQVLKEKFVKNWKQLAMVPNKDVRDKLLNEDVRDKLLG